MPFDGGDFESWLEQGLDRALGAHPAPTPLASQAGYHAAYLSGGFGVSSFGSSVVAALTSKAALAGATAAIVVGGGTAVAATTASGSANPTNWGQYISQTVVPTCKEQAASAGLHGIGACVSSIARTHGQAVASAARHHGASDARDNDQKGDHGKASEARANHPTGKSSDNPGQGHSDGNGNGGSGQGNSSSNGHGPTGKH